MSTSPARKNKPARELLLALPFPPSVNHYWRHVTLPKQNRQATLISKAGREYRQKVLEQCVGMQAMGEVDRLSVEVTLIMPDRRRRDIDNYQKSLFDALTHAGIWGDDSQVDQIIIQRALVKPPGGVQVRISPITDFELSG
jgi:crossover junction endodeoxyribonuclease RusA